MKLFHFPVYNICDKIFKLKTSLIKHEKIKHPSVKISAGNGSFLLANNDVQTKQKDSTCNICHISFSVEKSYKRHVAVKHNVEFT